MAHNVMPGKQETPRQAAALSAGPEMTERLNNTAGVIRRALSASGLGGQLCGVLTPEELKDAETRLIPLRTRMCETGRKGIRA